MIVLSSMENILKLIELLYWDSEKNQFKVS